MTQIINDERYKRGYRPYTKPEIPEQSDESGVDGVEVKKVEAGTLAKDGATTQAQPVQTDNVAPANTQQLQQPTQPVQGSVSQVETTPTTTEKTTTVNVAPEQIVYNATEAPTDKEITKTAGNLVAYDDSRNAVRDFGRYVKHNSYGGSYDWEQIQNSMKPDDIKAFQKSHGLVPTGIIGKKTYALLKGEWEKQQAYEENLGNNLANALKPNEGEQNKGKSTLIKETVGKDLKDWIDRYSNAEPTDFANDAVSELQTILNEAAKTNPRIQEILIDDKFGEQTMTTFMQALFTDSDLQTALGLRDADGKKNIKAYSHIMDMLKNDGGDEHAEYVRNYALRQQDRNKKFQALSDMVGLIRDGIVASGGVDPGKRDSSAKYKEFQKYMDEANKNYRDYIEERNKTILGLEKASEDAKIKQNETEQALQNARDIAKMNNDSLEERQRISSEGTVRAAEIRANTLKYTENTRALAKQYKVDKDNEAKLQIAELKSRDALKVKEGNRTTKELKNTISLGDDIRCITTSDISAALTSNGVKINNAQKITGPNAVYILGNELVKLQDKDPKTYALVLEDLKAMSDANLERAEASSDAYRSINNQTANIEIDNDDNSLFEDNDSPSTQFPN